MARATSNTQSVSDALSSGTRTARPFSLPSSSGKISPIAVADPVVVGISETLAARARRRSLCGASIERLRVRHVVQRRDLPVPDPDPLVDHLHHGREAVSRARGRRQQIVASRVVEVVVDADDHVQRPLLHRCGDDDLAHALAEIGLERLRRAEPARALEHDLDAELAPRHIPGLGGAAVAKRASR